MAGPPSGYVLAAAVIFGVWLAVLSLTVVVFAWHDARHVAALRAEDGLTAPGAGHVTAPATAASDRQP